MIFKITLHYTFFPSERTCISEQSLYENRKKLHRFLRGRLVSICFRKLLLIFFTILNKKSFMQTNCSFLLNFTQIQLGLEQGLTSPNILNCSAAHAVFVLCCYTELNVPKICWCIKKYLPTFFQSVHSGGGSRPRSSHKAPGISSWWTLELEGK